MRKLLTLQFLLLTAGAFGQSEAVGPFEKYGYKVKMYTSSKGEFEEFHDQTEVVAIGSALFNTRTKQIVGIVDDTSITHVPAHMPTLSVDPEAARYYWITPYAYCNNNPIRLVDPNGREFGDFFDQYGTYLGTDGNKDTKVFIVTNYDDQQRIKENRKNQGTTNASTVNIKAETTYEVLNEAVNVYDRTVKNGGNIEEASALSNNGQWHQATGNSEGTSVVIPLAEGQVTIHSHPFKEGTDGGHSTPEVASPKDLTTFTKFNQNIIVGKDGGNYDPVTNWRTNRVPTMSFYNRNNSSNESKFNMPIENVQKMINRWKRR
jgi:hypothetical protein